MITLRKSAALYIFVEPEATLRSLASVYLAHALAEAELMRTGNDSIAVGSYMDDVAANLRSMFS